MNDDMRPGTPDPAAPSSPGTPPTPPGSAKFRNLKLGGGGTVLVMVVFVLCVFVDRWVDAMRFAGRPPMNPMMFTGDVFAYNVGLFHGSLGHPYYLSRHLTPLVREDLTMTMDAIASHVADRFIRGDIAEIDKLVRNSRAIVTPKAEDFQELPLPGGLGVRLQRLGDAPANRDRMSIGDCLTMYRKQFASLDSVKLLADDTVFNEVEYRIQGIFRFDVRGRDHDGNYINDRGLLQIQFDWDPMGGSPGTLPFVASFGLFTFIERLIIPEGAPGFKLASVHDRMPPKKLPPRFMINDIAEVDEEWWGLLPSPMWQDEPTREGLYSSGAAVEDFDGDGDLDVVLPGLHSTELLENRGNGKFAELSLERTGLYTPTGARMALPFDANGDGLVDLLILSVAERANLFLNRGNLKFEDVTAGSGFDGLEVGFCAAAADVDGDGDLDIATGRLERGVVGGGQFTGAGRTPLLWLNDGKGRFAAPRALSKGVTGRIQSIIFADMDDDGHLDVVAGREFDPRLHLRGDGKGGFVHDTRSDTFGTPERVTAVLPFDANGDSLLELLTPAMGATAGRRLGAGVPGVPAERDAHARGTRFYRNRGSLVLTEERDTSGVRIAGWAMGGAVLDYDLDGARDLYVTNGFLTGATASPFDSVLFTTVIPLDTPTPWRQTLATEFNGWSLGGHQRDVMFRGNGDGTFVEVGHATGTDTEIDGRCAVAADLDGDGDQDLLLVERMGRIRLLQNNSRSSQSSPGVIVLRLHQAGGNSYAVGARVRVSVAGRNMFDEVRCGSGSLGHGPTELIFGLGNHQGDIDEVEVRWPDGSVETWQGVPANKRILLERGSERPASVIALATSPEMLSIIRDGNDSRLRPVSDEELERWQRVVVQPSSASKPSSDPGDQSASPMAQEPEKTRVSPGLIPGGRQAPPPGGAGMAPGAELTGIPDVSGEFSDETDEGVKLMKQAESRARQLFARIITAENERREPVRYEFLGLGPIGLKILGEQLASPDPEPRAEAAKLLAAYEGTQAEPLIDRALSDEDPLVRAAVIYGIGRAMDRGRTRLVLQALKDESLEVQRAGLNAMMGIRPDHQTIYESVLPFLEVPELRREAFYTIAAGEGHLEALEAVLEHKNDKRSNVLSALARCLGSMRQNAAAEVLIEMLRNNDAFLRLEAAQAMALLENPGGSAELKNILQDEHAWPRAAAVLAASNNPTPELTAILVKMLTDDPSKKVREAVGAGAIWIDTPEMVEALITATYNDKEASMRAVTATSLIMLGHPEGIKALRAQLKAADSHFLLPIISILGTMRDQESRPKLVAIGQSTDDVMIQTAVDTALGRIDGRDLPLGGASPELYKRPDASQSSED